ncbi:MAG: FtsX-like permease family protein [Bacteroidales bacterium]|nr:FtsX-like permease family protein [Bacteroidales bacterium]
MPHWKFYIRIFRKFLFTNIIKIIGATLALSTCIILLSYYLHESNFDSFQENKRNLFRVISNSQESDFVGASSPINLGQTLKDNIPGIKEFFRYQKIGDLDIKSTNDIETTEDIAFADIGILESISISGYKDFWTEYFDPNTVLISKTIARKIFNNQSPENNIITVTVGNRVINLKVVGVFDDFPNNSIFQFHLLAHFDLYLALKPPPAPSAGQELLPNIFYNTFLLTDNVDVGQLEEKINSFIYQFAGENFKWEYSLQNIEDVYLESEGIANNWFPAGDRIMVRITFWLILILLLTATLNHVLISNSQLRNRYREFGIRKVYGASIRNTSFLIIFDNILILAISGILSILIVYVILSYIENFVESAFYLDLNLLWKYISAFILIGLIFIFLSSVYSIFQISSLNPIGIIKNKFIHVRQKLSFVKIFLILQLIIFISLTSLSILGFQQMNFIYRKDLGFNAENTLAITVYGNKFSDPNSLISEIKKSPYVISISSSRNLPFLGPIAQGGVWPDPTVNEHVVVNILHVDYDFFNTMGIEFIEGRDFNREMGTDLLQSIILNESAIEFLGIEEPYLDKEVNWRKLIGVVEDFHMLSLHHQIQPTIFLLMDWDPLHLIINYKSGHEKEIIDYCNQVWKEQFPDDPLYFYMMNDVVRAEYDKENFTIKLTMVSAIIVLIILMIGLYGLSYFISNNKAKEMCMRKVFGANPSNVFNHLIKVFLLPVVISFGFSIPLTIYIANEWLNRFAYHVEIGIDSFILSLIISCGIIFISSIHQLFKLSIINPIVAIKYE